ncbi:MAG: TlpA family protein disulfide reductase [Bacteroidetes bacterium]|nr:TlpA family protein disulfide reductase [Bacteroidota bacterium]
MNKKRITLIILVIAALIGFYFYNKYNMAPSIDFNKLTLSDLNEKPVKFSSFKGKKMVVCFSASWCGNCLDEMKEMNAIKDVQLSDVEIVIISDEPLEKIMSLKERTDYPFTFLKMNQQFNDIGIFSIPTSYIVNTNLEVKKETVGYVDWTDASTVEHLKKLME